MTVPPTRPQPVYRESLPPYRGAPRRARRKLLVAGGGVIGVLVIGGAVTVLGRHGPASAAPAGQGQAGPHCYAVAEGSGSPFTIAEFGTSDCTAIAAAASISLASIGYRAAPSASMGPGSVICEGTVTGFPVTVIAAEADPALCDQLGLAPVLEDLPLGARVSL